jgi:hypothetical protein
MGYKHKQYDDISIAIVGYNVEWQLATTLLDVHTRIDSTMITEWNWWLEKLEKSTK